ncbi:MAG: glycosyl transferase family 4 [Nanoarchaeota archaeon]|nr:glycosyl transferase family 4 [Nanoarchaeota archaeon]
MTDKLLIIPILASFLITLSLMPFWIRKAKEIGLLWEDMNKLSSEKVAGSGGLMVVAGFVIGVLLFVAYSVFYLKDHASILVQVLALLSVILLLSGIGFIDDLFGWRKGGLSRRSRLILVAVAAVPLMVINAGRSGISVPFVGFVDLGIFYPLLIIPIGIAGATTTYNFLAGFNGLEAGQGIILLSAFAIVAYFTGFSWLAIIALCMVAALIAFLFYNFCPAQVFPGDSITYAIGGLLAIMAILGNFEKIAVFFFIPYIIETILKLRGGLTKHSFGRPAKDGSLDLQYDKIYGIEHAAIFFFKKINIKPTERKVVGLIWAFQIVIIIIGFLLFKQGIFLH